MPVSEEYLETHPFADTNAGVDPPTVPIWQYRPDITNDAGIEAFRTSNISPTSRLDVIIGGYYKTYILVAGAASLATDLAPDDYDVDTNNVHWALLSSNVSTIFGTPTVRGLNKEVWLSLRTDNNVGSGTPEDPFDASTQAKLEAIFQGYQNSQTDNLTFNFAPGTYHLIGAVVHGLTGAHGGWAMRPGWKIKGAGKYLTTIVQDFPPSGDIDYPLFVGWTYGEGNMVVEDLTIDLGFTRFSAAHPNSSFTAITLTGSNCYVRNVRILHAGRSVNNVGEVVAIYLQGAASGATNNLAVENCEIYADNIINAIVVVNPAGIETAPSPVYGQNARINYNYVECLGSEGYTSICPAGFNSAQGIGNVLKNCHVHADTNPIRNAIISNNEIRASYGMIFECVLTNSLITNNTFFISTTGIQIKGSPNGISTGVLVKGNRIVNTAGATYGAVMDNQTGDVAKVANIVFKDNVIDAGLTNGVIFGHAGTNITWDNNTTPSGNLAIQNSSNVRDNLELGPESPVTFGSEVITGATWQVDNSLTVNDGSAFDIDLAGGSDLLNHFRYTNVGATGGWKLIGDGLNAFRSFHFPNASGTLALGGAVGSSGLTMSTAKLLGRSTASTGAIEEITLGTNLSFSGTTLNATAASGTVTATGGTLTANSIVLGAGTTDTKVVAGIITDGTSKITLGVAGTSVGSLAFKNATSGTLNLAPPTGALGTINVTMPNASSTLPIFGQQITFSGPTAARTITLPDAAFTVARTDAANTFTGVQTLSSAPILSAATANTFAYFDGSKNLVSAVVGTDYIAVTGTPSAGQVPIASDGTHAAWGALASLPGLTTLGIRSTGAAFDLTLASSEVLSAGRTLSLNVGNAARTLTFSGSPTLGDWFDQSVKTTATPTFTGATISSGALTMSGNQSAAAWTTSGLRLVGVAGTLTDTTSSGTVAAAYTNKLGGNTIAASSATTFTNYISSYFSAPIAGANVTLTNKWGLGADGLLLSGLPTSGGVLASFTPPRIFNSGGFKSVPFEFRYAPGDNGDGTYNNVMKFGFNPDRSADNTQAGGWFAFEPKWTSGGATYREFHLEFANTNSENVRLFSNTFIDRGTLATSNDSWYFSADSADFRTLASQQLYAKFESGSSSTFKASFAAPDGSSGVQFQGTGGSTYLLATPTAQNLSIGSGSNLFTNITVGAQQINLSTNTTNDAKISVTNANTAGNVVIELNGKTSGAANPFIQFEDSGVGKAYLGLERNSSKFVGAARNDFFIDTGGGAIVFAVNDVEKARIGTDGSLLIGTTTNAGAGKISANGGITTAGTLSVTGASTFTGAVTQGAKTTTYNNIATEGNGLGAIVKATRVTAQTAAGTIATYTTPASDGSYLISGNINVTAAIALSTSLNCDYTDETNTARTMIIPITGLAGTFLAGGLATTTGPFESSAMHIRTKASTAITISTAAGTFTSVTYNAEGVIRQLM